MESKFIGLDTMDFWINNNLEDVKKLFPLIDILIINENEAKLISKENNLKHVYLNYMIWVLEE